MSVASYDQQFVVCTEFATETGFSCKKKKKLTKRSNTHSEQEEIQILKKVDELLTLAFEWETIKKTLWTFDETPTSPYIFTGVMATSRQWWWWWWHQRHIDKASRTPDINAEFNRQNQHTVSQTASGMGSVDDDEQQGHIDRAPDINPKINKYRFTASWRYIKIGKTKNTLHQRLQTASGMGSKSTMSSKLTEHQEHSTSSQKSTHR